MGGRHGEGWKVLLPYVGGRPVSKKAADAFIGSFVCRFKVLGGCLEVVLMVIVMMRIYICR